MPVWLRLSEGPVMRFALAVLVLGLGRLAVLAVGGIIRAVRRAGDRQIPYRRLFLETLGWLFPVARLHRTRRFYSYASFAFHLGILAAGLFLANHLEILQAVAGIRWASLAKPLLDALTLVTLFSGGYLLLHRIYVASSRRLSKASDYLLLVVILNIFGSGYLAGRGWNPLPYDRLMLFHTLNGILLLLVIPFTKIAHCVLFPVIRLASEVAWHLTPKGGSEVVRTLYGPEGRQV